MAICNSFLYVYQRVVDMSQLKLGDLEGVTIKVNVKSQPFLCGFLQRQGVNISRNASTGWKRTGAQRLENW